MKASRALVLAGLMVIGVASPGSRAGALAWQVMCGVCYDMRDQFGIPYPPASAATNVLAQHAAAANAGGGAVFTVGATTATPAVAAPDQTVTVQTSVTAAVAASDPQAGKSASRSSAVRASPRVRRGPMAGPGRSERTGGRGPTPSRSASSTGAGARCTSG